MMRNRRVLRLILLFVMVTLAGCQSDSAKTRKILPEWSRGLIVGVAGVNRPIALLTEDEGTSLAWVGMGLQYARIDRSGTVVAQVTLPFATAHPAETWLCPGRDDTLRLLWIDNPQLPAGIYLARVSRSGDLLTGPIRLTPPDSRAASYAVASGEDGILDIFWATDSPLEGGINHVRLSADDQVLVDHHLVVTNGTRPTLQVSRDGKVHLVYLDGSRPQENNVYYSVFELQTMQMGNATRVARYASGTGLVSPGPVIGLDDEMAYIFWALEQRGGGQSSGEAQTSLVSFPLSQPAMEEAVRLDIPGTARPRYAPSTGSLPYQRLATIGSGWPTSFLYMPAPIRGQVAQLGLFLSGRFSTRSSSNMHIVWAIFDNGELHGYQLPVQADSVLQPNGALDPAGNVHLTWLQPAGFGAYEVCYASTAPEVRLVLDRVTAQDVMRDALNMLWSLTPALGFFPPVLMLWTILPFMWVIGFYFVKVEGGLDRRSAQVALVVAVVLYLLCKLFLMPFVILDYAPFLDRLPEGLHYVSQLGTPAVTLLLGYAAFRLYLRRAKYGSLFAGYLVIVVTDALLSMILYIPGLLGG